MFKLYCTDNQVVKQFGCLFGTFSVSLCIIIIKKNMIKEHKQDPLEEFINRSWTPEGLDQFSYDKGLENGAKWQQEQDKNKYSEEEVIEIAKQYAKRCQAPIQSTEWLLEQFKKK
jgi:hypothetical protein